MDAQRAEVSASAQAPVTALHVLGSRADRWARHVFIWPAAIVILALSIFPLIISLYLSLSRFKLVRGGFEITFIGLLNYRKLLLGSEQKRFLGVMAAPSALTWVVLLALFTLAIVVIAQSIRQGKFSIGRVLGQVVGSAGLIAIAYLLMQTILVPGGRPGTMAVTLVYVLVGIALQYLLGLGLALLCVQQLPGRRFFRVVFLLPMMITPVGVAYMFRMMTDTGKGPLKPLWDAAGLTGFSWVTDPWGARAAVMIGDIWQWTPFMFIVLVAALEAQSVEPVEAAHVDGATGWQIFRFITLPSILPVSTTLILIRLIEAFKIVDLPNVMTGGGPGTATESMSLFAYISWRSQDLGLSAAIAYGLLILVTFMATIFVQLIRSRATEAV
jgi:multiple sugar transport system permease protein